MGFSPVRVKATGQTLLTLMLLRRSSSYRFCQKLADARFMHSEGGIMSEAFSGDEQRIICTILQRVCMGKLLSACFYRASQHCIAFLFCAFYRLFQHAYLHHRRHKYIEDTWHNANKHSCLFVCFREVAAYRHHGAVSLPGGGRH